MYRFDKTIKMLVKALETKGKYYHITSRSYKIREENGEIRYGKKFKYVDIDNKDNYIETGNNNEVLQYLLGEWEKYKD